MKRIITPQTQSRLNNKVQVELTIGELALLYVAVGEMSTLNFERILSLPKDDMDSVVFSGISNAELTQYLAEETLYDDLAEILYEEGVSID